MPALLDQRQAEVVVSIGVLGVEFDGLLEDGDGLVILPLAIQRPAEVAVGNGVLGVELDGFAEDRDRLVVPSLLAQRQPRLLWA